MQVENFVVTTILLNCRLSHIIQILVNNIDSGKDLSYIFLNVILGMGAFRGLEYLKMYKEKRDAATFTFWIQLRVRMVEIKSWLESEHGLIDCLYDKNIRSAWESESGADEERIDCFKKLVQETFRFVKSSSDQMPVYSGWTDDYNRFITFLNDIIQFDISNGEKYFKFEKECSINERNKYVEEICMVIEKMSKEIVAKQQGIEDDL